MDGPGPDTNATTRRSRRGRLPGDDLADAVVLDLSTGRPLSRPSMRAARDTKAVLDGTAAGRPIVVFCHIRGESEPFPKRWRWGQLTIGAGQPEWRHFWFGSRRPSVTIPEGTVSFEQPRPLYRSELSASCPNPRRALVVPLDTPAGRVYVGVARQNAPTVVAAFPARRPGEQPPATAGT